MLGSSGFGFREYYTPADLNFRCGSKYKYKFEVNLYMESMNILDVSLIQLQYRNCPSDLVAVGDFRLRLSVSGSGALVFRVSGWASVFIASVWGALCRINMYIGRALKRCQMEGCALVWEIMGYFYVYQA